MEMRQAVGEMKLWYEQSAEKWEEALPIGNGKLGGMVFGGPIKEKIALNEDTLWAGVPRDTNNYDALRYLQPVRELVAAGQYTEAHRLVNEKMVGVDTQPYQPLGDLILEHRVGHAEVQGYYRELDLPTGIATVLYHINGVKIRRESFVSAVDGVLAVHLETDGESLPDLSVMLTSPLLSSSTPLSDGILLKGRSPSHVSFNSPDNHPLPIIYEEDRGLSFGVLLRAFIDDQPTILGPDGQLNLDGARSVTLLLAAATDYESFDVMPVPGNVDFETILHRRLASSAQLGYAGLRRRHVQDHASLFGRVQLRLGSKQSALPTDKRLEAYRNGNSDPALEALYFQYGRYLLMASSRPGSQPANLQGIWNTHLRPPWNSDYTTNINTQMNYWHAETAGLPECHEPLLTMIGELAVTGSRTALIHYGAHGWTAHHNVDLWRMSTPSSGDASWALWPLGGAWLCRHLWEHYLFGLDIDFLKAKAFPLMKGAALFCLDWLILGEDGKLMTSPSTSPENKFLTSEGEASSVATGSTMDIAIIRELLTSCRDAIHVLELQEEEKDFVQNIEKSLSLLPDYKIGSEGQLQEWNEDFPEAEPGHRHVSHLYGVYPGNQINQETPELLAAVERTLERRLEHGGGHTGWSCAWLICLYARLKDGEQAHHFIRTLLSRSTYPNLFDDHPPFQIDGNFGGAAGIAEMLLQSQGNKLELLPALPSDWSEGEVKGLRARGGFTVDISWKERKLQQVRVSSSHAGICRLAYNGATIMVTNSKGGSVTVNGNSFEA